jgi:NAD(P)-dependent dehydrogenase (short-subunit alcohol dehydrogenase family)
MVEPVTSNLRDARAVPRPFEDRVALVTGASSGIGRAIAIALAAHGAGVCLVGRDDARLADAAAGCEAAGTPAIPCRVDLTSGTGVGRLADMCARLGRLDILVHSAAEISFGRLADAPPADFDRQYAANLRVPFLLTQALLPLLRTARGQIVFVNSSAGLRASAGVSQYSATKHGLRAIADALRDEVNEDGIRVLTAYVGRTATPMQAKVHETEGRTFRPAELIQPEDVAAVIVNTLSLPRTVEVTDITMRPAKKPAEP